MKFNILTCFLLTVFSLCVLTSCNDDVDYPDYPIDLEVVSDPNGYLVNGINWIDSEEKFIESGIVTNPETIDFNQAALLVVKGTEEAAVESATGTWNMVTQGIHRVTVNVLLDINADNNVWYVAFLLPQHFEERIWLSINYTNSEPEQPSDDGSTAGDDDKDSNNQASGDDANNGNNNE